MKSLKLRNFLIPCLIGILFASLYNFCRIGDFEKYRQNIHCGCQEESNHIIEGWSKSIHVQNQECVYPTSSEASIWAKLGKAQPYSMNLKFISFISDFDMELYINDNLIRTFKIHKAGEWSVNKLISRDMSVDGFNIIKFVFFKNGEKQSPGPGEIYFDRIKFENYSGSSTSQLIGFLTVDTDKEELRKRIGGFFYNGFYLNMLLLILILPPLYFSYQLFFSRITGLSLNKVREIDSKTYLWGLGLPLVFVLVSLFSRFVLICDLKSFIIIAVLPTASAKAYQLGKYTGFWRYVRKISIKKTYNRLRKSIVFNPPERFLVIMAIVMLLCIPFLISAKREGLAESMGKILYILFICAVFIKLVRQALYSMKERHEKNKNAK